MLRSIRTLSAAAVLALALSACGGGAGTTTNLLPAGAPQQAQSGSQRHTSSSCTPDSYGYCLAYTSSQTVYHYYCYNDQGIIIHTSTQITNYELYHNGSADGAYSKNVSTTCGGTDTTWTPEDPSAATGDPNLP